MMVGVSNLLEELYLWKDNYSIMFVPKMNVEVYVCETYFLNKNVYDN